MASGSGSVQGGGVWASLRDTAAAPTLLPSNLDPSVQIFLLRFSHPFAVSLAPYPSSLTMFPGKVLSPLHSYLSILSPGRSRAAPGICSQGTAPATTQLGAPATTRIKRVTLQHTLTWHEYPTAVPPSNKMTTTLILIPQSPIFSQEGSHINIQRV